LRTLRAGLSDADLSLGWLSHQSATVAGKPAFVVRVSFAGELGWEVHCANADQPEICAAILAGGATPFGMYALNALRIEKGRRSRKGDLSSDYSLFEGGLERFAKLDKVQDFRPKAALRAEIQQGVKNPL
jgi:dimethylglycine dehydrogenase